MSDTSKHRILLEDDCLDIAQNPLGNGGWPEITRSATVTYVTKGTKEQQIR